MSSPMAVDQELSDSDSSLDSASEELQDPHLDSLDLAQSTSTYGAKGPVSSSSLTISHTSVEIHSFSDSPVDSASVSLHSSSTVGVPPTLSLLEDDTESDSPFASLTRRISLAYVSSRTQGGAQGCKLSSLASSTVRSFCSHSPSSGILQQGVSPVEGDPGSPRSSSSARRPSFNFSSASSRPFHRGFRRPRPSLPSRLETLTAYYKKRGCSRIALQIFK